MDRDPGTSGKATPDARRSRRRRAGSAAPFHGEPAAQYPVVAFGATGSGREIAGSLLTSCYGKDAVFVVNEIVAHATGALHYDRRVDTIFEIGGQDAKYIRLADGRIIDCAMNEACSAGTGFVHRGTGAQVRRHRRCAPARQAALAARAGVSLGQHCSVFMAEVIDEAVAAGVEQATIISGLYDSIIQNYLNRVKGSRSVGKVIFCQGMPFSADALAAAVARQTGSEVIVPPNPGTVGALGIALLAARELAPGGWRRGPARFLEARVEQKGHVRLRRQLRLRRRGQPMSHRTAAHIGRDQPRASPGAGAARCTTRERAKEAARPRAGSVPRTRGT